MPEGNSQGTIKFNRTKLKLLLGFYSEKEIETVQQIDPGAIRLFLAWMEEAGHNPGGVHAAYRTLGVFLYWWE